MPGMRVALTGEEERMENEAESPKKGLFGYEGEGFDEAFEGDAPPEPASGERAAGRGWNIGREDDAPDAGEANESR